MNVSQRTVIGAVIISGILIVAASVGIWAMFLNDDAPAPVSLQDAVASLETPTAGVATDAARRRHERTDGDGGRQRPDLR